MLAVVATLKIKEGHEAEFEAVAKELAAAVNANEAGCHLYTLNKGDEPLTYIFLERYEDDAAAQAHRDSDHFKTLGAAMGPHMAGRPDVLRLKEV